MSTSVTIDRSERVRTPQESALPAVRLEGLSKSFRGHLGIGRSVAVDRLSLEVRSGEILGLLGPNGAGKTTTIKMIVGLLRPQEGRIELLSGAPGDARVRARIGYLPENPYFYDHLTAEEFLDFYARLQGLDASARSEVVPRTLRAVGLAGSEKTALRKFSKGMLQRVGLAQAIQHVPDLLILDEPMSGLDPIGRRDVRDLILAQRAAGRTVLFSSHILQDVEMICDRVAILDRGRLRSIGRLHDLVSAAAEGYEVSLSGTWDGAAPAEVVARDGANALLRVPDVEALGRVLDAAREAGCAVSSVTPVRRTLEDLFLREVGR
jgi:ABC-2 type transport system ATP-binding protein